MIGEVDHRAQVQILLRIGKDLREDMIRIENTVRVGRRTRRRRVARCRVEFRPRIGVAVVVVDMTAHQMQDDEVIRLWINTRQVWEQALVILGREIVGVICPLRHICRLGDHRDRTVELPIAPLIAKPIRLVADLLRHIEDRRRLIELLVVVLALLRQRALQHGDGLRPRGVDILIDQESVPARHALQPRRILVREPRRIGVHIVARRRLTDDEDHRPRRTRGKRILQINDERLVALALI